MTVPFQAVTPDSLPTTAECRAIFIPDDPLWRAAITGALLNLTYPWAWEFDGGQTPDDCAEYWVQWFDKFCFKEGSCRMIGEIIAYAGSTSPDTRWLPCDGSSLLRADYPDLYAVIGTAYGAVDGSHFSLPDMRGRTPVAAGAGTGLSARSIGDSFGEETHTLITSETPSHSHSDSGHTHSEVAAAPTVGAAITGVPIPSAIPSPSVTGLGFASISATGGDGAHNNLQPSLVINYLIVALP